MNWKVLIAVSIGVLIVGLDMTIVNLALPPIAKHFSSSLSDVKWVLTAYLVCGGSLILVMGRLGDRYGLKFMYLAGLLVFAIFSFLCGISQSLNSLIFSRVCQGVGLAACFPTLFALTSQAHGPEQQGHAFGFVNVFLATSLGLGPTIGGALITWLSWRWVFFLSVPIALAAFIAGIFCIDTGGEGNEKDTFSYLSATLFSVGLGLILFALNQMIYWTPYSPEFIGTMILGILLLIFMGAREKNAKVPLINISRVTEGMYVLLMIIRESAQFFIFGVLLVMSLFLENILQFTSFKAGLVLLFMTVSIAIVSLFAGRIMQKVKLKKSAFFVLTCCTIGAVLLLLFRFFPSMIFIYIGLVFVALGGMPSAIMFMLASLKQFPTSSRGLVFGVIYTFTILGGSLGTTFTSYVLSQASSNRFETLLGESSISLDRDQINTVETITDGGHSLDELSAFGPIASKLKPLVVESFYHAYAWVFWMFLIFFFIGFVCLFFYRPREEKDAHMSQHA